MHSPPSLTVPRVSQNHLLANLDRFVSTKPVSSVGSLGRGLPLVTQDFDLHLSILLCQDLQGVNSWLKLWHIERLEVSGQAPSGRPPSINVTWSVAMRAWRVVYQVFNRVAEFSYFRWVALHDVIDEDAHDLLGSLVDSFDEPLFHGSVGIAEALTYSKHRKVLVH